MSPFKIREQLNNDDCWRTAIANILQLPVKSVPHFLKLYDKTYILETRKWLEKRGKGLVYIPLSCFLGGLGWADNGEF